MIHKNYLVSIIITAHNYAKYLSQCIDSALNQNFENYEIIVVNDGSTDHTKDVLKNYESNNKIRIYHLQGVGLASASNFGIQKSKSKYIIRLDADDYFDENILLLESNILDKRADTGMVYPDYYLINKYGNIIEHIRLPKVNDEIKLFDRSPLAAGAMYRRSCYDAIGGYNEDLRYQEDYDFWLRFIEKFNVYNINLPLMYYRRHNNSMSGNAIPRIKTRRYVKSKFAKQKNNKVNVLGVIPARANDWQRNSLALQMLNGKPVIAYSIEEALKTKGLSRIIVSTDCVKIAEVSRQFGAETPFIRPKNLSLDTVWVEDILRHTTNFLENNENFLPDMVVALPITSPLRKAHHIQEAIDTMILHDTDSVISVFRDTSFHWKPGKYGLKPIIYKKRLLRHDKESFYRENGVVYLYKIQNIKNKLDLGKSVGHIEMLPEESLRIRTLYDFWVIEQMIKQNKVIK